MKKALPLIMAALVAASLAGCGSTKTEATTAAPAETTTAAAAETTKEALPVVRLFPQSTRLQWERIIRISKQTSKC